MRSYRLRLIGQNNANCNGCGSQWDNQQTAPVGSFKPNPFGLYDTAGNVWEWTCSRYTDEYDSNELKCDITNDGMRVLRSGSWYVKSNWARSADRAGLNLTDRVLNLGVRVIGFSR